MRESRLTIREVALCTLFGAAAWLLPVFFHLIQLGSLFMPMYLPLVALAFMVRPGGAVVTALTVPLLSGLVTGMPPFFPPVALFMAVELAVMGGVIAFFSGRWRQWHPLWVLIPALLLGRVLHVAMAMGFAQVVNLPPRYVGGLSLVTGWPGIILMIVTVPVIVSVERRIRK